MYLNKHIFLFVPASVAGVQGDASKQQLLLQVLTQEEQLECFLRERSRSLDAKVQQAALWSPTATQTDHSSQHDQHDQHPQAIDTRTDTNSENLATGYVNISGVDLPCRTVDAGSLAAAGHAQRLVHTSAMVDNIEAAALALCQNRPLLLEGPPGMLRLLFYGSYSTERSASRVCPTSQLAKHNLGPAACQLSNTVIHHLRDLDLTTTQSLLSDSMQLLMKSL